jgi:hypothetical protein
MVEPSSICALALENRSVNASCFHAIKDELDSGHRNGNGKSLADFLLVALKSTLESTN